MKAYAKALSGKFGILACVMLFPVTAVEATENAEPAELTTESPAKVSWFRQTFLDLTYEEVSTVVKSPKEIARRVKTRVDYVEDSSDELKSPMQTWDSKTGDCEDFAACVVDLCEKNGYEAWIEVFYEKGNGQAHAVAMGRWKGKLWISSNGSWQKVKSMKDACHKLALEQGWDRKSVAFISWDDLEQDRTETGLTAVASATRALP